jgi:hypothetical protein
MLKKAWRAGLRAGRPEPDMAMPDSVKGHKSGYAPPLLNTFSDGMFWAFETSACADEEGKKKEPGNFARVAPPPGLFNNLP